MTLTPTASPATAPLQPPPSVALTSLVSLTNARHFAVPATFAWYGMLMGSWAGRLPGIQQGLHLTHSQLAMVLLCSGTGAVLSPRLSAPLLARLGRLHTLRIAGWLLPGVLVAAAASPSLPLLMAAMLVLGITSSVFDVAMNGLASRLEAARRRPMMSRLHGCACGGGLAGVTLGSAMASLQVTPLQQFSLLSLPLCALLWLCLSGMASASESDAGHTDTGAAGATGQTEPCGAGTSFTLPRGRLALLGALSLLGAIAEGSIGSWSSLFMKEQFGASDAMAPLSLSVFSLTMLVSRCFGDRLKSRHGARALVCAGSATAACGLGMAVLAPGALTALAGFAMAGLGLALVFPFVYSAAGKECKLALAGVATMGYAGSLMGPPLMGAIAEGWGLQAAIACIALLTAAMAMVASRARLLQ